MAEIVVIQASPRDSGVCAHVSQGLIAALEQRFESGTIDVIACASLALSGCIGCNYCATHSTCCFNDDMSKCIQLLDQAQMVFVVSPVYFSGAPSQFKAFLDRLQPFYWKRQSFNRRHLELPEKHPAYLYVVGAGNDPHGYDSLITEVTSAFALADFRVLVAQTIIGSDRNRWIQRQTGLDILPKDF